VVDNYHSKHPELQAWLDPRITPHFTFTSGSWLRLVEVLLGTRRCRLFTSTKSADEIMPHARRGTPEAGLPVRLRL
jgi:hypothetical protein